MEDVRTLLEAAGDDNPAAAQGFVYVAAAMAAIDERLPRAILRCAFSACVHPYKERAWLEEEDPSLDEDYRRQVSVAIAAELSWLAGERKEPEWPLLAPRHASPRYGSSHVREEGVQVLSQRTDVQAAGLWLGNAATLFFVAQRPWLRDVAKAYSEWTFIANGSELADGEEPDNEPAGYPRQRSPPGHRSVVNGAAVDLVPNRGWGGKRFRSTRLCVTAKSYLSHTAVSLPRAAATDCSSLATTPPRE